MQILRIHEVEFMKRVLNDPTNHWGEKQAKRFYDSLWKKLIDARTRERTNKLRRKHAPKMEKLGLPKSDSNIHNDHIHIEIQTKDTSITTRSTLNKND